MAKHNLFFYSRMMEEIRESIRNDSFKKYYLRRREEWSKGDQANPMNHPVRNPLKNKSAIIC